MEGKVYLVGAGPGDPELLTLRALKSLRTADVVLHDDLVGPEILALVPPTAQVHNVGKRCGRKSIRQEEINRLLVQHALLGFEVVRLKSGDPLIFGRGGEEIEALRQAQIKFEVIPGVTAALGAAATAQIPLTHRRISSALMFLPGQHASAVDHADWPAQISPDTTLVIYMPGFDYEGTAQRLLSVGISRNTPCAIVSRVASRDEQVHRATVADLPSSPRLPAPTLLVVGEVVRYAEHASLHQKEAPPPEQVPVLAEFLLYSQRTPDQERAE